MRKNILKFILPILGIATVAISLPIALTSCSNNKSDSSISKYGVTINPVKDTYSLNNDDSFSLPLSISNPDNKSLNYQWYYNYYDLNESNNTNKYQTLKGQTSNTLNLTKKDIEQYLNYQIKEMFLICKITIDNEESIYTNPTILYLKDPVKISNSNIDNFEKSSIFSNKDICESLSLNNEISNNSSLFNKIKSNLNLDSNIDKIYLSIKNQNATIYLSLNNNYCWPLDLLKETNNYQVDSNGYLIIKNLKINNTNATNISNDALSNINTIINNQIKGKSYNELLNIGDSNLDVKSLSEKILEEMNKNESCKSLSSYIDKINVSTSTNNSHLLEFNVSITFKNNFKPIINFNNNSSVIIRNSQLYLGSYTSSIKTVPVPSEIAISNLVKKLPKENNDLKVITLPSTTEKENFEKVISLLNLNNDSKNISKITFSYKKDTNDSNKSAWTIGLYLAKNLIWERNNDPHDENIGFSYSFRIENKNLDGAALSILIKNIK